MMRLLQIASIIVAVGEFFVITYLNNKIDQLKFDNQKYCGELMELRSKGNGLYIQRIEKENERLYQRNITLADKVIELNGQLARAVEIDNVHQPFYTELQEKTKAKEVDLANNAPRKGQKFANKDGSDDSKRLHYYKVFESFCEYAEYNPGATIEDVYAWTANEFKFKQPDTVKQYISTYRNNWAGYEERQRLENAFNLCSPTAQYAYCVKIREITINHVK